MQFVTLIHIFLLAGFHCTSQRRSRVLSWTQCPVSRSGSYVSRSWLKSRVQTPGYIPQKNLPGFFGGTPT